MLDALSQRLLTLLQLTRMALVFTAISNSMCTLLLALRRDAMDDAELVQHLDWRLFVTLAFISIGMYGFGMSLNDIIDRRRDRQIAAHRPLPSGRIRLLTAHLVCASFAASALIAGAVYATYAQAGWWSFVMLLWTGFLITFYDFAGKYLVGVGLLTLGLIRFFHAVIPAPGLPLLWHPLLLFTHVTILSAVSYAWEEKRPPLTHRHWIAVLSGIAAVDLLALTIVWCISPDHGPHTALWMQPGLILPFALGGVFIILAWRIRRRSPSSRQAGQTLMLSGLLWLIVYDSAFVAVYVGLAYAGGLLLLVPVSYLMVQIMRWWSKVLLLSQQPNYKRIRSSQETLR